MSKRTAALTRLRGVLLVAGLALLALPAAALAGDTRKVLMKDRCDPASFNAMFGDVCFSNGGGVPVDVFLARLNPKDFGHSAWRFSPGHVRLASDRTITAINTGAEVHSFTQVAAFGGGIIPPLNAVLPPGTPLAQPIGDPRFMAPGETRELPTLSPAGTYLFQCLIHPWQRTVVEQG